jgi:hypothetical protein
MRAHPDCDASTTVVMHNGHAYTFGVPQLVAARTRAPQNRAPPGQWQRARAPAAAAAPTRAEPQRWEHAHVAAAPVRVPVLEQRSDAPVWVHAPAAQPEPELVDEPAPTRINRWAVAGDEVASAERKLRATLNKLTPENYAKLKPALIAAGKGQSLDCLKALTRSVLKDIQLSPSPLVMEKCAQLVCEIRDSGEWTSVEQPYETTLSGCCMETLADVLEKRAMRREMATAPDCDKQSVEARHTMGFNAFGELLARTGVMRFETLRELSNAQGGMLENVSLFKGFYAGAIALLGVKSPGGKAFTREFERGCSACLASYEQDPKKVLKRKSAHAQLLGALDSADPTRRAAQAPDDVWKSAPARSRRQR